MNPKGRVFSHSFPFLLRLCWPSHPVCMTQISHKTRTFLTPLSSVFNTISDCPAKTGFKIAMLTLGLLMHFHIQQSPSLNAHSSSFGEWICCYEFFSHLLYKNDPQTFNNQRQSPTSPQSSRRWFLWIAHHCFLLQKLFQDSVGMLAIQKHTFEGFVCLFAL